MLDLKVYDAFLFDLMGTIVKSQEEGDIIATPGLTEFLTLLQEEEKKLAVVTSASREKATFILNFLGIDSYFHTIITADDVVDTKPSPEPYLKALEELGVSADASVAFEDSLRGISSAKDAGLFVVYVGDEELADPEILDSADLVINNFYKLLKPPTKEGIILTDE